MLVSTGVEVIHLLNLIILGWITPGAKVRKGFWLLHVIPVTSEQVSKPAQAPGSSDL